MRQTLMGFLNELGINQKTFGYWYLLDAVAMVVNGELYPKFLTKYGYPRLAKINDTTASSIERCIRHAIYSSWKRNPNVYRERLGFSSRPSNGMVIFALAYILCDVTGHKEDFPEVKFPF